MDWTKLNRRKPDPEKPRGAYTNLDELIRIQFEAKDFSFLPQQPVTSVLAGRYASRLRGRGLNFEELRRYQPGDDIRTMDWKVTARTRNPHVRVFTEEKDRQVLLVIDQRINMFFGTRQRMKSVTAAHMAALGAWRAVDVGDRVGAVVFNDTDIVEHRPQRSEKSVMGILHSVLQMNHALEAKSTVAPNPAMLNAALEKAARLAKHDVLVVIVSDFFGIDAETERLIARMTRHNDLLGFLVHDPVRLVPPGAGITVSDGSLQMEVDFSSRTVREKVVRDYGDEQEQIRGFLRKLSAPLLLINNEEDVVAQVRKYFGIVRGEPVK
ncbi:MAG: DUF58 domain-containing protein [Puniceicoccaceae bacterium]